MYSKKCVTKKTLDASVKRRALLKLLGVGAITLPVLASHGVAQASKSATHKQGAAFWRSSQMDVIEAIHRRRSYRDFTGEPIPAEDLQTILSCGMAAPSARNLRPWEFVVLTKPESLKKIPLSVPMTGYATKAGAAIVLCVNTKEQPGSHLAIVSSALSAENMMLACTGLGYGAVWVELYPNKEYIAAWKSLASLPEHILPLCLIIMGKPNVMLPLEDRTDMAKVHYEAW